MVVLQLHFLKCSECTCHETTLGFLGPRIGSTNNAIQAALVDHSPGESSMRGKEHTAEKKGKEKRHQRGRLKDSNISDLDYCKAQSFEYSSEESLKKESGMKTKRVEPLASSQLFFIDKRSTGTQKDQNPTLNVSSSLNFTGPKASSTSSDDTSVSREYIQNILKNIEVECEEPGKFSKEDDEFAKLVQEYSGLMNSESQHNVEHFLDQTAARLLEKRKSKNPEYVNMDQRKFEQIMLFEQETYSSKGGPRHKHRRSQVGPPARSRTNQANFSVNASTEKKQEYKQINFKQLNRDVKAFINNENEQMQTEPSPPMIRRLIHQLAYMYGLKSCSNGKDQERFCVLIKTKDTRLPTDLRKLDRFLEGAQKAAKYAFPRDRQRGSRKNTNLVGSTRMKAGTVVGQDAAPIEDTNIGSMMLKKLGWTPGQGLGSKEHGITQPVEAVYRTNRVGLGH